MHRSIDYFGKKPPNKNKVKTHLKCDWNRVRFSGKQLQMNGTLIDTFIQIE